MQSNQNFYCSNPVYSKSVFLNVIKNIDYSNINNQDVLAVLKDEKDKEHTATLSFYLNKKDLYKNILNICLRQKYTRIILIKITDIPISAKMKIEIRQDALILEEACLNIDLKFECFILIRKHCKI